MLKKLFFIFGCISLNKIVRFRSSHQSCSTATLLKKRLWHWRFPVNFAKFLRTNFYRTPPGDCFCTFSKKYLLCTLSRFRLVQTRDYYLLQYFEVKQMEAVFRRFSTCSAIKKRLQHRCFPGKCAKFSSEKHFSTEQLRWLLLNKPKRSLSFIVWRSDAVVIQHKSILVIQYHAKIVKTKNPFDMPLFSKLKHAVILLLSYILNCE